MLCKQCATLFISWLHCFLFFIFFIYLGIFLLGFLCLFMGLLNQQIRRRVIFPSDYFKLSHFQFLWPTEFLWFNGMTRILRFYVGWWTFFLTFSYLYKFNPLTEFYRHVEMLGYSFCLLHNFQEHTAERRYLKWF